jgi:hypothetical protein
VTRLLCLSCSPIPYFRFQFRGQPLTPNNQEQQVTFYDYDPESYEIIRNASGTAELSSDSQKAADKRAIEDEVSRQEQEKDDGYLSTIKSNMNAASSTATSQLNDVKAQSDLSRLNNAENAINGARNDARNNI